MKESFLKKGTFQGLLKKHISIHSILSLVMVSKLSKARASQYGDRTHTSVLDTSQAKIKTKSTSHNFFCHVYCSSHHPDMLDSSFL